MPLSPAQPRTLVHTRIIECNGYERADGLWDIEGHLVDTKTIDTPLRDGGEVRKAGDAIHDMWLRLTIDLDMRIHDAEAAMDAGPHAICRNITPNFKRLKGITIGAGWRKKIYEVLGGIQGCTHLVELLGPVGTTAFQATVRARERYQAGKPQTRKPHNINACHVYDETGPAVKQRWPQFYTGKP